MHDPIALAVPFFFVLIAIEVAWAKKRGVSVYRLSDAITDLSCGITSQIVLLTYSALLLAIYTWVYDKAHLITYPRPWMVWLVAFIGVDFFYYWWHRMSHEKNLLWAAHVVHHQSEDYNLAVALRQSVLTAWTALPFYLPLAVLGVPTLTFAIVHALSTLYQFWIHTQLVGKIKGPLDWIFNLPSHHRVHHAINPQYLDKNYGATLIVWDRIFGTYIEENETPVYGITDRLTTFDPMWAQIHYWFDMAKMSREAKKPSDKIRVWFASPAWKPEGTPEKPPVDLATRGKYDPPLTAGVARYLGVQYIVVLVGSFAILMWHRAMPTLPLVLASVAVLGALVSIGGLIENRRWALWAEAGRLGIAGMAMGALFLSGCHRDKKDVRIVPLEGESSVLPRTPHVHKTEMRSSLRTVKVGSRDREYFFIEPPLADKPLPLVLVFHGDGGDATGFHAAFPFERASGTEAFVAYPDGLGRTWDLETADDNRDIAFVETLIGQLASQLPIDRSRVFATGYSSGGFLSNLIACQKSELVRAIASNAGGAPYKQRERWPNGFTKCPGQKPVAALALHGRNDFGVTLDSGRFSAAYWAYVDGCNVSEMEGTGYDECHAYRGCPSGKAVAFCDVPGLGHWVWDRAAEASWTFFTRL